MKFKDISTFTQPRLVQPFNEIIIKYVEKINKFILDFTDPKKDLLNLLSNDADKTLVLSLIPRKFTMEDEIPLKDLIALYSIILEGKEPNQLQIDKKLGLTTSKRGGELREQLRKTRGFLKDTHYSYLLSHIVSMAYKTHIVYNAPINDKEKLLMACGIDYKSESNITRRIFTGKNIHIRDEEIQKFNKFISNLLNHGKNRERLTSHEITKSILEQLDFINPAQALAASTTSHSTTSTTTTNTANASAEIHFQQPSTELDLDFSEEWMPIEELLAEFDSYNQSKSMPAVVSENVTAKRKTSPYEEEKNAKEKKRKASASMTTTPSQKKTSKESEAYPQTKMTKDIQGVALAVNPIQNERHLSAQTSFMTTLPSLSEMQSYLASDPHAVTYFRDHQPHWTHQPQYHEQDFIPATYFNHDRMGPEFHQPTHPFFQSQQLEQHGMTGSYYQPSTGHIQADLQQVYQPYGAYHYTPQQFDRTYPQIPVYSQQSQQQHHQPTFANSWMGHFAQSSKDNAHDYYDRDKKNNRNSKFIDDM